MPYLCFRNLYKGKELWLKEKKRHLRLRNMLLMSVTFHPGFYER